MVDLVKIDVGRACLLCCAGNNKAMQKEWYDYKSFDTQ